MDTSADGFAPDQDDATALATRRLTLRAYADPIAQPKFPNQSRGWTCPIPFWRPDAPSARIGKCLIFLVENKYLPIIIVENSL